MLSRRQFARTAAVALAALLAPSDGALAALDSVDRAGAKAKPRFLSRPDMSPPVVAIDLPDADPSAGHLFIASFFSPNPAVVSQYGPQILDVKGNTLWFKS